MQNNENNIDKLFEGKLANFEVEPPLNVWDNISESMGHNGRKRRMIWMWAMSSAASIVIAFIFGWYLASSNGISDQDLLAELNNYKQASQTDKILLTKIEQNIHMKFERPAFKSINYPTNIFKAQLAKTKESREHTQLKFMANKGFTRLLPNTLPTSLIGRSNNSFSNSDRFIIESNLLAANTDHKEEQKGAWAVGVQASPVYRFENQLLATKSQDALYSSFNSVQNNISDSYESNLSGGLSIAYETGKRLSIITGINYDAVAQSSGGVALSYAGHNWMNERNNVDYLMAADTDNKLQNLTKSTNNVILNTQVGFANIELPEGAQIASAKSYEATVGQTAQNNNFEQEAVYVEVPLLLRYKLIDKRIGLHVMGGVNTNLLVDNTAQLTNNNEIIANGQIEGLRPLTFSSSFGLGMNYAISEKFNLNIEPTLKVNLTSLNTLNSFYARPYAIGVFSGISYNF